MFEKSEIFLWQEERLQELEKELNSAYRAQALREQERDIFNRYQKNVTDLFKQQEDIRKRIKITRDIKVKNFLRNKVDELEREKRHLHQNNKRPKFKTDTEKEIEFKKQQLDGMSIYIDGLQKRALEKKLEEKKYFAAQAYRMSQEIKNGLDEGKAFFDAINRIGERDYNGKFREYLNELEPNGALKKEEALRRWLSRVMEENRQLKVKEQESNKVVSRAQTMKENEITFKDSIKMLKVQKARER